MFNGGGARGREDVEDAAERVSYLQVERRVWDGIGRTRAETLEASTPPESSTSCSRQLFKASEDDFGQFKKSEVQGLLLNTILKNDEGASTQ